jgi:alpha-soluble NSF attachment protein
MSAIAKAQKAKGQEYQAEAGRALTKKSWFASARDRNVEDAAELYLQAANAYKVGGLNQEAGDVYNVAGELYRDKLKQANEAAKCFTQAGRLRCVGGTIPFVMRSRRKKPVVDHYTN